MHVLLADRCLPNPPWHGRSVRMAGLRNALRGLGHEVSCLGVGPGEEVSSGIYSLGLRVPPLAHATGRREWRTFQRIEAQRGRIDLLIVSNPQLVAFAVRMARSRPVWFEAHVVERDFWRDRKGIARLAGLPLSLAEGRLLRTADLTVCLSAHDAARLRKRIPKQAHRVVVLPHSVKMEDWPACDPAAGDSFVFVGTYSNPANQDSVQFILQELAPPRQPRNLRLVGEGMPAALARQGVEVHGRTPRLVEALLGSRGALAPVFVGSGVRTKVLESMASGLPVIATAKAMEGIYAVPGRDFLPAEDGPQFLAAMRQLEDAALAHRIGTAGRRVVERDHAWTSTQGQLQALLSTVSTARTGH